MAHTQAKLAELESRPQAQLTEIAQNSEFAAATEAKYSGRIATLEQRAQEARREAADQRHRAALALSEARGEAEAQKAQCSLFRSRAEASEQEVKRLQNLLSLKTAENSNSDSTGHEHEAKLKEQISTANAQLSVLQQERMEWVRERENLTHKLNEMRLRHISEIAKLQRALTSTRSQLADTEAQLEAANNEKDDIALALRQNCSNVAELESRVSTLHVERMQHTQRLNAAKRDAELTATARVSALEASKRDLTRENAELTKQLEEAKSQLAEITKQYDEFRRSAEERFQQQQLQNDLAVTTLEQRVKGVKSIAPAATNPLATNANLVTNEDLECSFAEVRQAHERMAEMQIRMRELAQKSQQLETQLQHKSDEFNEATKRSRKVYEEELQKFRLSNDKLEHTVATLKKQLNEEQLALEKQTDKREVAKLLKKLRRSEEERERLSQQLQTAEFRSQLLSTQLPVSDQSPLDRGTITAYPSADYRRPKTANSRLDVTEG
ncbi:MAG: hypothetical protein MHM6MM_000609 [Cercozoa sp. M6MM]